MNRDYADATATSDGGWRETSCMKGGSFSAVSGYSVSTSKKRNPSTLWKNCPNYVPNQNHQSTNDWHVEMSLPKVHSISSGNNRLKEFAGSCTAMVFGREVDISKGEDAKYDYDGAEDNVECSSMSDLVSGCFETKHVTVDEGNSATLVGAGHNCATEDVDLECPRMQERKSLDSTVTDLNSHGVHECCLNAATELTSIRKQLLDIETKQSNLLDLLQAFMGNSEDKLSTLQLKVHNLEYAVDKIVKNISYSANHSDMATSKFMKSNQSITSSPRLSTSTPRPSVESNCRQSSLSTLNNNELWGINEFSRSRSSTSVKEGAELWRDPTLNIVRNCVRKKDTGRGFQSVARYRKEETRDVRLVSSRNTIAKQGKMEAKSGFWKQIKEFLQCGDMESAYAEALYSGDELCLIELMNRTGPVLERLSWELTGVIISILTTQFLDHKFMDSIIPWILQVVDLCTTCEPMQLAMSSKSRLEFLYAVQKLASMECIDTVDKIAVAEFAAKLSQLWGEAPSRKMPAARASEGNKTTVVATRV